MAAYVWRVGDRFTNGTNVWRVASVDGKQAVLQSESTAWAKTMPVTVDEWKDAAPGFALICVQCDGAGVITVAPGGNPDAEEQRPCPTCGRAREDDPRERGEDDGSTYADPRESED